MATVVALVLYLGSIALLSADLRQVQRRYGWDQVGWKTWQWVFLWLVLWIISVPYYLWCRHRQKLWPMWPPPTPGKSSTFEGPDDSWWLRERDGRWYRGEGGEWVKVKPTAVPQGLEEVLDVA